MPSLFQCTEQRLHEIIIMLILWLPYTLTSLDSNHMPLETFSFHVSLPVHNVLQHIRSLYINKNFCQLYVHIYFLRNLHIDFPESGLAALALLQ